MNDTKARGSRGAGRQHLSVVKTFFNWAVDTGDYGLESSPCDRMKPKAIFGPKPRRSRFHSDLEMLAVWRAAQRLGFPYGPLFQFLILCGKRKSEPAMAVWSEFNLKSREWIVPSSRTKNGKPHYVYLTDGMISLLKSLPIYHGAETGPYLFSTTFGLKPVNGFSKVKERLDRFMLEEYNKILEDNGEKRVAYNIEHYVIHDFRKDIRTTLSKLGIRREIGRLVIGHTIGGLDGVYDLYAYMDEKRDALEKWEGHLRGIGCAMDYEDQWHHGRTPSLLRPFSLTSKKSKK